MDEITLLMQRNGELCLWLSCGDMVSCSYGIVGNAAMKGYGVVQREIAKQQIQSHIEHGWEVIK